MSVTVTEISPASTTWVTRRFTTYAPIWDQLAHDYVRRVEFIGNTYNGDLPYYPNGDETIVGQDDGSTPGGWFFPAQWADNMIGIFLYVLQLAIRNLQEDDRWCDYDGSDYGSAPHEGPKITSIVNTISTPATWISVINDCRDVLNHLRYKRDIETVYIPGSFTWSGSGTIISACAVSAQTRADLCTPVLSRYVSNGEYYVRVPITYDPSPVLAYHVATPLTYGTTESHLFHSGCSELLPTSQYPGGHHYVYLHNGFEEIIGNAVHKAIGGVAMGAGGILSKTLGQWHIIGASEGDSRIQLTYSGSIEMRKDGVNVPDMLIFECPGGTASFTISLSTGESQTLTFDFSDDDNSQPFSLSTTQVIPAGTTLDVEVTVTGAFPCSLDELFPWFAPDGINAYEHSPLSPEGVQNYQINIDFVPFPVASGLFLTE